ncbi:MAG: ABC transporter ATP-binding protein [Aigarchaeota archaeon]|nr:ABC transporter ATP-binding protein [Candidatus Pelearchaeum maunauluense]
MIEVQKINAGYGRLHILFDADMHVREKSITVIVGPNGSGKSTLLKSIFGLTKIYSGVIKFDGENIVGLMPHQIARRGVAYLPQTDNVFANLTVRENLLMASYTLNKRVAEERLEEVLELFPMIKGFMNRKSGTLSGGERQMVAMAMALLRKPKIMMFDEPTGNLAPKLAMEVLAKIRELRDRLGITILLVEQNARRALEMGDYAYLLVSGRVAFEGRPQDLLGHAELSKLYLGISS